MSLLVSIIIIIIILVLIYYVLNKNNSSEGLENISQTTSNLSNNINKRNTSAIRWTQINMPLLAKLTNEYKESQPFAGKKISVSLHITNETFNLCMSLKTLGGDLFVIPALSSTTNPLVVRDLRNNGITVATEGNYIEQAIIRKPEIILDDGAQIITEIHSNYPEYAKYITIACEQTETGVLRIKELKKVLFPIVLVNSSPLKLLMDSRYGTGESAVFSFLKATHVLIAGKKVVIVGFGWVGAGVSKRLQGMGAQVIVVEIDPIKYLDALMQGMEVMNMEQASFIGDIFMTQTGQNSVINKDHYKNMKSGSFLCNFGHENVEINVPELEEWSETSEKITPDGENFYITAYKNEDKVLYLLGDGNVLNLSIAYGNSPNVLDCSFSLQLMAAIKYSERKLPPGIYQVDSKITNDLATEKLKIMTRNEEIL